MKKLFFYPLIINRVIFIEKKFKKKRFFILTEVIVALVIISICSLPLAQIPMKLVKKQITTLETIETERLFDETYSLALEKIYLSLEKEDKNIFFSKQKLPPSTIELDKLCKKRVDRFFIAKKITKESPTEYIYKIKCKIFLLPKGWKKNISTNYRFCISKQKKS